MNEHSKEYLKVQVPVNIPYHWAAGIYVGKFLELLRDEGKIYGAKCPSCGIYQIPPRIVCGRCHVKLPMWPDWDEMNPQGTVITYSIAQESFLDPDTGDMRKVPYTVAGINPDGVQGIFEHLLEETDPSKLTIGMKVEVVLKPKESRQGNIRDIIHFKTI